LPLARPLKTSSISCLFGAEPGRLSSRRINGLPTRMSSLAIFGREVLHTAVTDYAQTNNIP
jgi:hypothetical protein